MAQNAYAEDVVTVSGFASDPARLMARTRETHRPLLVTVDGTAANVVLGAADYRDLIGKLELLDDLRCSERDVAEGRICATVDVRRAVAGALEAWR